MESKESEVQCFDVNDRPYGKTYGQWTATWWRWALSIPESISPLTDETGENAHVNQPEKDVWFLAGTIATKDSTKEIHREVTIPSGRAILLPVMNFEANFLEYPHLKTDEDLIEYVLDEENTIVRKDVTINGKPASPKRMISDPRIFTIFINDNNPLHVRGGMTKACADGYYLFLKPLSKGEHDIRFRAACQTGTLNSAAKYRVNVT
jgi:hypothetical protein